MQAQDTAPLPTEATRFHVRIETPEGKRYSVRIAAPTADAARDEARTRLDDVFMADHQVVGARVAS